MRSMLGSLQLLTFAAMAGEHGSCLVILPLRLPCHAVFNIKREEIVTLMDTALFAAVARAGPKRGLPTLFVLKFMFFPD